MAWFKWDEITTKDPKWQWVAVKSGHCVAFVLAVWAMLLERASAAAERGSIVGFDCESADVAMGMPEGACCEIMEWMERKGVIADGRIARWDERQTTRRGASSGGGRSGADRVREYRARRKAAEAAPVAPADASAPSEADAADVTPCNDVTDVTECNALKIRVDKSREEEEREESPLAPLGGNEGKAPPPPRRGRDPALGKIIDGWVAERVRPGAGSVALTEAIWEFVEHRKALRRKLTPQSLAKTLRRLETLGAADQWARVIEQSIANGWTGIFPLQRQREDRQSQRDAMAAWTWQKMEEWDGEESEPRECVSLVDRA